MRIAISALVGVLLAAAASFGAVQLANASQQDPVIKPLYNYGSR
ncbi:hypothetical protein Arub01_01380 [Actinomadura rubrobrunea]|uniref:DUF2613 family protein n=1 Tax=Actinomadura rubrobrunea TaxID=115335 RepID=A0A9W6USR8_9ACTN|nr:hypothetical protein [Actinomadura rubrobrunea]GLW61894.1 hypothetical protein Arub01_01380 [Actinomadura rubrobrunea]